MVKKGGAVLWARQTLDSDIFYEKPHIWFKIWFYLVAQVNHKDNKRFKRGTCFLKYEWIKDKTKASRGQIDHCIRWLKSAKQIATRKATRGFIVEVLNYNSYQTLDSYKEATGEATGEAIQKRHRSDTINKYDKYVSKEEEKVGQISFDYKKGKFTGITQEYINEMEKKYPGVKVIEELCKMRLWLLDNPNKKRQGKRTFIDNWCNKAKADLNGWTSGLRRLPQGEELYGKRK